MLPGPQTTYSLVQLWIAIIAAMKTTKSYLVEWKSTKVKNINGKWWYLLLCWILPDDKYNIISGANNDDAEDVCLTLTMCINIEDDDDDEEEEIQVPLWYTWEIDYVFDLLLHKS